MPDVPLLDEMLAWTTLVLAVGAGALWSERRLLEATERKATALPPPPSPNSWFWVRPQRTYSKRTSPPPRR